MECGDSSPLFFHPKSSVHRSLYFHIVIVAGRTANQRTDEHGASLFRTGVHYCG
jgi:hypothetical protein